MGLKKWWVLNTVTKNVPSSNLKETQRLHQVSEGLNFVKEFLWHSRKMSSHHCGKDTRKLYLEPASHFYGDICCEYLKIGDEGKQKMSRTVLCG
ncbi:hypothetical protein PoB_004210300 [Plakobranchus ocellatus]|uniref:Uncharacterized protein n=1 Tax=Plakobranchus ocellatus TaxID=259542 RepID=A0AAV4B9V6_9GAST|nr:hypothetical protein PoB_004210300 [Plakobranchus ocellatus]